MNSKLITLFIALLFPTVMFSAQVIRKPASETTTIASISQSDSIFKPSKKSSDSNDILPTAAIVISIISLIISLLSYVSNQEMSKATLLHQVKTSIDDAKTQLENRSVRLAPLQAKKKPTAEEQRELDALLEVYESSLEKVINAYEDGCQKYYSSLILKEEFKKSYFNDIRDYVEKFEDKFTGPVTRYTYILKIYKEWHKPKS